jgi:hypothetical protein
MTPEIFCLCEAVTIKHGQLCILHTILNGSFPQAPAFVSVALAAKVRFMHNEEGVHRLETEATNADGAVVWRGEVQEMKVFVDRQEAQYAQTAWQVAAEFWPGTHEFFLRVDGTVIASALFAVLVQPPQ